MPPDVSPDDRSALAGFAVSRETVERLQIFARELIRWQGAVNLVAPSTIPHLWTRHIADSIQLSALADGPCWVDLGSGAGLPGLVIAAAQPSRRVVLIESDGRKCAFIRHALHAMGLSAEVIEDRIESSVAELAPEQWVVTARALASLPDLLSFGETLWSAGSIGLFPKGRDHLRELTEARESWRFDVESVPSRTDPEARILRISHVTSRMTVRPSGAS